VVGWCISTNLNPTEPFNLYLEVGFVGGLFTASPFVFYQLWLFIAPGLYRKEKRYVLPFLLSKVGLFIAGGFFGYKMVYPASLDFLIGYGPRFQPMITIAEYTKLFFDNHHWSRPDLRDADSRILSRLDAGDYSSLDVAKPALLHNRHFCCRGNGHVDYRHLEYVPFCRPDGRALCHQYWSGLAGEFTARTSTRRCLTCASCREREEKRPDGPYNRHRRSMYQSRRCRHSASLASFCCVPKRNDRFVL
jgi:hypothetical protein